MQTEMGLSAEEAEVRIMGNDLVNAVYIQENTDMKQHEILNSLEQKLKDIPEPNMVSEFVTIIEAVF